MISLSRRRLARFAHRTTLGSQLVTLLALLPNHSSTLTSRLRSTMTFSLTSILDTSILPRRQRPVLFGFDSMRFFSLTEMVRMKRQCCDSFRR